MNNPLTLNRLTSFIVYYSNSTSFIDYVQMICTPIFSYEQANDTIIRGKIGTDWVDYYANRNNKRYITLSAQVAAKNNFDTWGKMINAQYIRINSSAFTVGHFYATIESATISWNYRKTMFIPEIKFLLK